jgi:hypothetical protein
MYASYTFVEPPGSAVAELDLVGLTAGRISDIFGFGIPVERCQP